MNDIVKQAYMRDLEQYIDACKNQIKQHEEALSIIRQHLDDGKSLVGGSNVWIERPDTKELIQFTVLPSLISEDVYETYYNLICTILCDRIDALSENVKDTKKELDMCKLDEG